MTAYCSIKICKKMWDGKMRSLTAWSFAICKCFIQQITTASTKSNKLHIASTNKYLIIMPNIYPSSHHTDVCIITIAAMLVKVASQTSRMNVIFFSSIFQSFNDLWRYVLHRLQTWHIVSFRKLHYYNFERLFSV